jgi:GntR family transcriptional regulator, vanillate catabolism transcriptional regulator
MSGLPGELAIKIRQMILDGEFSPGDRMTEIPLAEKLGVSRTPTRAAMSLLEQDGILVSSLTGGYTVRSFTLAEIREAIDVRGTLEGLAAELIAQRGLSRTVLRELNDCLRRGDELVDFGSLRPEHFQTYVEMNARFHEVIIEEAASQALKRALEVNDAYPFSAARMTVFDTQDLPENYRRMIVSHAQHHAIVEAMDAGEAPRAGALMREHSNLAKQALTTVLQRQDKIPGAHLVADSIRAVR